MMMPSIAPVEQVIKYYYFVLSINSNETVALKQNETALLINWYRYNAFTGGSFAVAYGFVFITGLIGNVLVIFAVFSGERSNAASSMIRASNIFLANLALADLLVITCLPFTLVYHLITRKINIKESLIYLFNLIPHIRRI